MKVVALRFLVLAICLFTGTIGERTHYHLNWLTESEGRVELVMKKKSSTDKYEWIDSLRGVKISDDSPYFRVNDTEDATILSIDYNSETLDEQISVYSPESEHDNRKHYFYLVYFDVKSLKIMNKKYNQTHRRVWCSSCMSIPDTESNKHLLNFIQHISNDHIKMKLYSEEQMEKWRVRRFEDFQPAPSKMELSMDHDRLVSIEKETKFYCHLELIEASNGQRKEARSFTRERLIDRVTISDEIDDASCYKKLAAKTKNVHPLSYRKCSNFKIFLCLIVSIAVFFVK